MTYLFDLDFNDGDCPFTIDAKMMGNISHFVNHSVCVTMCVVDLLPYLWCTVINVTVAEECFLAMMCMWFTSGHEK